MEAIFRLHFMGTSLYNLENSTLFALRVLRILAFARTLLALYASQDSQWPSVAVKPRDAFDVARSNENIGPHTRSAHQGSSRQSLASLAQCARTGLPHEPRISQTTAYISGLRCPPFATLWSRFSGRGSLRSPAIQKSYAFLSTARPGGSTMWRTTVPSGQRHMPLSRKFEARWRESQSSQPLGFASLVADYVGSVCSDWLCAFDRRDISVLTTARFARQSATPSPQFARTGREPSPHHAAKNRSNSTCNGLRCPRPQRSIQYHLVMLHSSGVQLELASLA